LDVVLKCSIVDEDIELAETFDRVTDSARALIRIRYVDIERESALPSRLDRTACLFSVLLFWRKVRESHIRALSGVEICDSTADPGVPAGDESDAAFDLPRRPVIGRFVTRGLGHLVLLPRGLHFVARKGRARVFVALRLGHDRERKQPAC